MTEPQRKAAHELLKASLSQKGYLTATSIMELETLLHAIENSDGKKGANVRDPELYFFTLFGAPSPKSVWGLRVEGHHVSLHHTIGDGSVRAVTPSFFGADPAESASKARRRAANPRVDGRCRARADGDFDDRRSGSHLRQVAPGDILTKNDPTFEALSPGGVAAASLAGAARSADEGHRDLHVQMADDVAADRLAKIKAAGFEKVTFAWAGETEVGKKHTTGFGADVPRRIRQHAERRQPRAFRVARLHRRLRPRPAARTRPGRRATDVRYPGVGSAGPRSPVKAGHYATEQIFHFRRRIAAFVSDVNAERR
jgi:hypothetical protein